MAHLLGIDYGTKHVGVAVATGDLSEPVGFFDNNDKLFHRLSRLCTDHQVELIVIGLSEGEMAKNTRLFAQRLKAQVKLPVVFQDETLSSVETGRLLLHLKRRRQRSQPQDAYQAAFILQDYLDARSR